MVQRVAKPGVGRSSATGTGTGALPGGSTTAERAEDEKVAHALRQIGHQRRRAAAARRSRQGPQGLQEGDLLHQGGRFYYYGETGEEALAEELDDEEGREALAEELDNAANRAAAERPGLKKDDGAAVLLLDVEANLLGRGRGRRSRRAGPPPPTSTTANDPREQVQDHPGESETTPDETRTRRGIIPKIRTKNVKKSVAPLLSKHKAPLHHFDSEGDLATHPHEVGSDDDAFHALNPDAKHKISFALQKPARKKVEALRVEQQKELEEAAGEGVAALDLGLDDEDESSATADAVVVQGGELPPGPPFSNSTPGSKRPMPKLLGRLDPGVFEGKNEPRKEPERVLTRKEPPRAFA